ncbi:hypothetical protein [Halobacteriovorax sp. CON-3]|uniref:hypothetical protein n=1 Tax=Halobacteriovorax sp. CON-3 TaxID=3157710 RepID=UPI00371C7C58
MFKICFYDCYDYLCAADALLFKELGFTSSDFDFDELQSKFLDFFEISEAIARINGFGFVFTFVLGNKYLEVKKENKELVYQLLKNNDEDGFKLLFKEVLE